MVRKENYQGAETTDQVVVRECFRNVSDKVLSPTHYIRLISSISESIHAFYDVSHDYVCC